LPELRKDYVLDRYVIIATDRGKRPHQFTEEEKKSDKTCYFCPGNEHLTPPEKYRVATGDTWKIRVFDNKFPAVVPNGKSVITTDNRYFTYADAFGFHEIVVETSDHTKQLADLSVEEIKEVLDVYRLRINELSKVDGIKYVAVYKNKGEEAGCSIVHSHTQIVAYNLLPQSLQEKENAVKLLGNCPYCEIIQIEKDSDRRIHEDDHVAAFTPYASRFPYEAWIFPKRHVLRLDELTSDEMMSIAGALKRILNKLGELSVPYNFYLHYGTSKLHLQILIQPRFAKAKWAGFELSTETIINPVSPEQAAEFYRK